MTTALTGSTKVVISLQNQKGVDLATILDDLKISAGVDWSYGTGENQANALFHDQRSTDDTGETLDVYASGSLKDAFGDLLTMEALKLMYIKNTHATLTLEVFGGVANDVDVLADTSDILEIPPGGIFLWLCPTAAGIDTTTDKNIKLAAKAAGTITYDIVLMGLD